MRYEIEVGGRTRQVVVTRVGAGFAVTVDERTWHVDAARVDAQTLSLIVDAPPQKGAVPLFQGGDRETQKGAVPLLQRLEKVQKGAVPLFRGSSVVTVAADPSTGRLTVHVGATPVDVTVNGRRRWGRKEDSGGAGAGPQRVTAPMPGKIVRVLVQSGDPVRVRQPLVVVEAMKMENELRAARAGTIAEVHAREGALVEAGALLVVIQ